MREQTREMGDTAAMSQPYPPPGQGQLVINIRKPVGAMGMIAPLIKIDGYPAPARWELNTFPVTAGRHLVRISSSYLWEYGGAEQLVDIAPGQSVTVHYSPPLVTFLAGRIGFVPQPRPGLLPLILILAVPVLLVILVIAATVLSG
jgi:hypothetical protein